MEMEMEMGEGEGTGAKRTNLGQDDNRRDIPKRLDDLLCDVGLLWKASNFQKFSKMAPEGL